MNPAINDFATIDNYEGHYSVIRKGNTEYISYEDKPLLDFRFIIQSQPLDEYMRSFCRILTILRDHYSVKAAQNKDLFSIFSNMQQFHFLITKSNKKPINLLKLSIDEIFDYLNLPKTEIYPVKRTDKFVEPYGQLLWSYIHSASIFAESASVANLHQSPILHLENKIKTESLYKNEDFSDKVVYNSDIATVTQSSRNIQMLGPDSILKYFDKQTSQLQTIFLKILAQFNHLLLCSICFLNFERHNPLENFIFPAYLTRSMIGTVFNFHNLVNISKKASSPVFGIDEFCEKYNLILVSATKIYLNKTLTLTDKQQNEIILRKITANK